MKKHNKTSKQYQKLSAVCNLITIFSAAVYERNGYIDVTSNNQPANWTHVVLNYYGPDHCVGMELYLDGTLIVGDTTKGMWSLCGDGTPSGWDTHCGRHHQRYVITVWEWNSTWVGHSLWETPPKVCDYCVGMELYLGGTLTVGDTTKGMWSLCGDGTPPGWETPPKVCDHCVGMELHLGRTLTGETPPKVCDHWNSTWVGHSLWETPPKVCDHCVGNGTPPGWDTHWGDTTKGMWSLELHLGGTLTVGDTTKGLWSLCGDGTLLRWDTHCGRHHQRYVITMWGWNSTWVGDTTKGMWSLCGDGTPPGWYTHCGRHHQRYVISVWGWNSTWVRYSLWETPPKVCDHCVGMELHLGRTLTGETPPKVCDHWNSTWVGHSLWETPPKVCDHWNSTWVGHSLWETPPKVCDHCVGMELHLGGTLTVGDTTKGLWSLCGDGTPPGWETHCGRHHQRYVITRTPPGWDTHCGIHHQRYVITVWEWNSTWVRHSLWETPPKVCDHWNSTWVGHSLWEIPPKVCDHCVGMELHLGGTLTVGDTTKGMWSLCGDGTPLGWYIHCGRHHQRYVITVWEWNSTWVVHSLWETPPKVCDHCVGWNSTCIMN